MPYIVKDFPTQTISTSGANAASSGITLLDDVTAYACFTSGTVTTSAFIVQVEPTSTGTAWVDLKTGTANVLVLTSGCTIINPGGFRQMRFLTTAVETAGRNIAVTGQFAV